MNADLISRLVCAKFLFLRGREILGRPAPFSEGIAALSFHDASELCLRVVAEHIGARVGEHDQMQTVIDKIDKLNRGHVPCRTELNQLNRLRNNFKHVAIPPRAEDAKKCGGDVEEFLRTILERFTDVRFDELSLAQLVKRIRVRTRFQRAERALDAGDHERCVEHSAVALEVFLSAWRQCSYSGDLAGQARRTAPRNTRNGEGVPTSVILVAEKADEEFRKVWERVDLMASGIDLVDHRKFQHLAPHVSLSAVGTVWLQARHRSQSLTYQDARFCYDFALRSILLLQEQIVVDNRRLPPSAGSIVVTKKTSVIVFPDMHHEHEEIAAVDASTRLTRCSYASPDPTFVSVVFDDELAFIKADVISEQ